MRKIMRETISFCILVILLITAIPVTGVAGDKGGISITHVDIPLYEPGQKAIICWDGTNELLVLSTDIRAGKSTKVLEILPLPAEPTIHPCNNTIFESMKRLVEYREERTKSDEGSLGNGDSNKGSPPDVEIVFHESIGIHNLTVIKAHSASGFANWTSEFIRSVGLTPMSFPKAESLAESYISRDINYFVLDIIELTPELSSPEPIIYKFESKSVYYPMEITSLTGGNSHILLFILTPYYSVQESYEKKEDSFFYKKTTTWTDVQVIELKQPHSPVDFRKLTSLDVSILSFRADGVETYRGFFRDPDFHYIRDFFMDHNRVQISVYEYEGPVEMTGDISVSSFSTESIKVDEDRQIKVNNFIGVILIPPIVLVVLVGGIVFYLSRKKY